jgi:hypothetical protein
MNPKEQHRRLVSYLNMKVFGGDWHGVSDAANDLRVLEAQYPNSSHEMMCACSECDKR